LDAERPRVKRLDPLRSVLTSLHAEVTFFVIALALTRLGFSRAIHVFFLPIVIPLYGVAGDLVFPVL